MFFYFSQGREKLLEHKSFILKYLMLNHKGGQRKAVNILVSDLRLTTKLNVY